ncbi:MAG TPA: hypothetical protein VNM37_02550 [Candidatus Dormibacteraeota bacterium]|nr:hypothetical protein [Candidatus Dormibacteraeota bacterium]
MKTSFAPLLPALLAILGGGLASLHAEEPTAFALAKAGNRALGEEAKDRIVQIRSDKSINTLVPGIWYVVYYDPDAAGKATEIKFVAGQKVAVKHPTHLLRKWNGKELPKARLKVDSDKALDIAKSQPALKNLTLKASEMKLERRGPDEETPVWKVELWAATLKNPNRSVSIGEVHVNAEDGKVLPTDLKIQRVD